MRICVLLAAVVGLAVVPSSAAAAVLVNAVPKHLVCGDAIKVGVWAQPGTSGDRTVRIKAVGTKTGKTWYRRTATARTSGWQYWTLPSGRRGQCGATTIVYSGPGITAKFRVRFSSEGV